jgi:hypothetical protein
VLCPFLPLPLPLLLLPFETGELCAMAASDLLVSAAPHALRNDLNNIEETSVVLRFARLRVCGQRLAEHLKNNWEWIDEHASLCASLR